jgi:lipopolysaccharide/colanic/teichoic acid biosynthesis glycosyltransferase
MRDSFYTRHGKRCFDLTVSIAGLILLAPVLSFIAFLIKLSDGGPIFFLQKRIGQNFKPFFLVKFRSMVVDANKMGELITAGDDPRVTKVGRFLRKTKIDELPQIFNVLKGDISFVGARPEVEKYVLLFRKDYEVILKTRPGITDYATIMFRNEEDVLKCYHNPDEGYIKEVLPKKIGLYKKYLADVGFLTDLRLIFVTLGKIIYTG